MNIFSILKYIVSHPLNQHQKSRAVIRFIKWQINTRLNPYPVIYSFTEKTKLIVHRSMTGATQNYYCGLQDYHDMFFMLHLLRKEDFFVDIGANIGSYSILASGHIGAKTLSIEPVPSTFTHLLNNISINNIQDKITAYNIGLGSSKGNIDFTSSLDTKNHVARKNDRKTIKVPMEVLDDILRNQDTPLLLKIDVEGFETEVIRGALNTLQQNGLKAIIIELYGSGFRYGYDEKEIHNTLINFNFRPFKYNPQNRELTPLDYYGEHNTIYVRDLDFVQQRLKTAPKINILNNEI